MLLRNILSPLLSPLVSGVGQNTSISSAWRPKLLFSDGSKGALFDAFDLSSLPGAVVNARVATIYDKSWNANNAVQNTDSAKAVLRGTPAGENLVTDPFFYNGADWTFGAGWAISSPVASATAASSDLARPSVSPVVGKVYLIKFVVQARSAGSVLFTFGGVSGTARSAAGVYYEHITAVSTASFLLTGSAFTGSVRGLSVWDVSAGNVKAPYWLDFNGSSNFYAATQSIPSYPFTLASSYQDGFGSVNSVLSLYQGDTDTKILNSNSGRGLDWKESTVSAYMHGAAPSTKQHLIAEFAIGSNRSDGDLLPGSAVSHSNTFGTKSSFFVGKGRASAFYMTGRVYSALAISRALTDSEKIKLGTYYGADLALQCWGDSMTAGSGTNITAGYPARLAAIVDKWAENQGMGGQTSTQITARFVADTSNKKRWTNILWMGTNDSFVTGGESAWVSLIMSNIATCVAGLSGNKRFLVLGVTRGDGGSVQGSLLTLLDSAMLATYGDRFVNVRAYLQSCGDGSANDLADISIGLVPRSLRSDFIHLNDKGYQRVADLLAATLASKSWV